MKQFKLIAMISLTIIVIVGGMIIYTNRIQQIENGTFKVIADSECDK